MATISQYYNKLPNLNIFSGNHIEFLNLFLLLFHHNSRLHPPISPLPTIKQSQSGYFPTICEVSASPLIRYMDFLSKLRTDYYQQSFESSDQAKSSPLQGLCEAVAKDTASTAEEIRDLLEAAMQGRTPSYVECKGALLAHYALGVRSESPVLEARESVDEVEAGFTALASAGLLSLRQAVQLFQDLKGTTSGFGPTDVAKFRESLANRQPRKSVERSPALHRRHQSQPPASDAWVTLEDFREALQRWGAAKAASVSVAERLKASIREYKQAIEQLGENPAQAQALEALIATLERQLQAFERPYEQSEALAKQLQDQQSKSLHTIFDFYCRQQCNVGPKPTFEEITANLSHWNLGKFVKFAIDFDLSGKATDAQKLSKEELKAVFLMTCGGQRKMAYEQFLACLGRVAERRFDAVYDRLNGTNVAGKSSEDKRKLLYLELGLENPKQIAERMKRFGVALSIEKAGYRLPEDDLAQRYRARLRGSQIPELQEWKARKATQSSGNSALRSSVDSSRFSSVPADILAVRRPAPSNYSEQYQQRHNAVSVTWQALSLMHYSDINVGDNIAELIGASAPAGEEDLLERQYGLMKLTEPQTHTAVTSKQGSGQAQRMQGLMKLHEQKVSRGLKALRRTHASKSVNNSVSNKL